MHTTLMLPQHSTGLLPRLLCARSFHLYELSLDVSAVLSYADVSGHSSVAYVPFQMLRASHVPVCPGGFRAFLAPLGALEHFYQVSTGAPSHFGLFWCALMHLQVYSSH